MRKHGSDSRLTWTVVLAGCLSDLAASRSLSAMHLQEGRELDLAHLTAAHGELAMTNATEPTDIAVDGHVVRRVREHEFRLGAFEQTIVGSRVAGICAPQAMISQHPQVSGPGDWGTR